MIKRFMAKCMLSAPSRATLLCISTLTIPIGSLAIISYSMVRDYSHTRHAEAVSRHGERNSMSTLRHCTENQGQSVH